LPESRVTEFPIPASNGGVTSSLHVPRGARDSSIRLPVPQAGVAAGRNSSRPGRDLGRCGGVSELVL